MEWNGIRNTASHTHTKEQVITDNALTRVIKLRVTCPITYIDQPSYQARRSPPAQAEEDDFASTSETVTCPRVSIRLSLRPAKNKGNL